MIVANDVTPVVYSISRGHLHDAPQGRELLEKLDGRPFRKSQNGKRSRMLMDNRSYRGFRAGGSAQNEPSKIVAVRQKICKRRNEVERFFRRLKGFRRIFTRYDKLTIMFCSFLQLAMIYELLRNVV